MDGKISSLIKELKEISKNHCLEIIDGKHDGNDFYRFISLEIYGNEKHFSKVRQSVCDFQKESSNQPYFELFLPRVRGDEIKDKNPRVLFTDDVYKSSRSNASPSARDVYAAAEILGCPICILTVDLDLNEYFEDDNIDLKWKTYQPVLQRTPDKTINDVKLLLVIKGEETEFFRLKDIQRPKSGDCRRVSESAVNKGTTLEFEVRDFIIPVPPLLVDSERCHENKFENVLYVNNEKVIIGETMEGFDSWSPDLYLGEDYTLYRCISREMYGTDDFWELVRTHIINLEENQDYFHVFSHFVGESDDVKQKERDFKKHIEEIRTGAKEPGRGEIFAAASMLYLDIYVLSDKNDPSHWDLYRPIVNQLRHEDDMDSHITLSLDSNTKKFTRLTPLNGKRNRRFNPPKVIGNLVKLQQNIVQVAQDVVGGEPCCGMNKCGRHMHFQNLSDVNVLSDVRPNLPNPFRNPPVNIRHVMKLLRAEGRMIDRIDDYHNTLFRCISKEIYGTDDHHEKLRNSFYDSYSDIAVRTIGDLRGVDDTRIFQIMYDVVEWLCISVYVYRKIQDSSDIYDWTCFQPRSKSSSCRYYATWFYDRCNGKFDRIVPIKGCNCQLLPPVSLLVDNNEPTGHDLILEIPSEDRHRPMLCYLQDDCVTQISEFRHPLVAAQHSEYYSLLYLREDMKERFIDTVHEDRNSFFRCISKETFGTEEYFSLIREKCFTELSAKNQEYSELLKKRSQTSLANVISRLENLDEVQDEEIFLMATIIQTRIFVLYREEKDGGSFVTWKEFKPLREAADRVMPATAQASAHGTRIENDVTHFDPLDDIANNPRYSCEGSNGLGEFYLTLVRTSSGHYDRIVPKSSVCNCTVPVPHIEESVSENRIFPNGTANELHTMQVTRQVDESLSRLKIALNSWLQINEDVEKLCNQIIQELEERRQRVSIATIAGGGGGLLGVGLAIGGIVAAPFTFGASLGLTIAGAVLGGSGAITMAGAKATELYLGKQAANVLEKKQKILEIRSSDLKESLEEISKNVKKLETDIRGLVCDDSMDSLDTALVSTIGALLRAVKELYVIPLAVLRISSQSVALVSAILLPLAVIVDVGSIVHAGVNLSRGSKTNVSENLRCISAMLRACRIQLRTWAYGHDRA